MKKTALIIIAIALLISACKSETINTDDFVVTPVPALQPLRNQPDITDSLTEIMRDKAGWGKGNAVYNEVELNGETFSFLKVYLVSSGVFDTVEITLDSGDLLQADVVYAYQLNLAQQVIVVPVVIGAQIKGGNYTYYADTYDGTPPSRDVAQLDAKERLAEGAVFIVVARNTDECYSITRNSLVWEEDGSTFCRAGAQLDRGYIQLVVMQAATSLPDSWMMMGWHFMEIPDLGVVKP